MNLLCKNKYVHISKANPQAILKYGNTLDKKGPGQKESIH